MSTKKSIITTILAICLTFSGLSSAAPILGRHHGGGGHHHIHPIPTHLPGQHHHWHHHDHWHHRGFWRRGRWVAAGAIIAAGAIAAESVNNSTVVTNSYDCRHVVTVRRRCHWNAWGNFVCRRVQVISNQC